jgi:acetyl esterase/lipase
MPERNLQAAGWTDGAEVLHINVKRPMVRLIANIVYQQRIGNRSSSQLRMDVLVPDTPAPKPAVLFFPGGGWVSAVKERFGELRWGLAQEGFVVASAEYSLIPSGFPAPLEDGLAALRFLRAHAEDFSLDPDRVGICGNSAGGWMALMVALSAKEPERPCAVCALHPVTELGSIAEQMEQGYQELHGSAAAPESLMMNGVSFSKGTPCPIVQNAELCSQGSPLALLAARPAELPLPPVLLVHGNADRQVSPLQSTKFFQALRERGEDARYVVLEGADHSSDHVWYQKETVALIADFFKGKNRG